MYVFYLHIYRFEMLMLLFFIFYEIGMFGTCVEISLNFPEGIYYGHFASVMKAKVGELV